MLAQATLPEHRDYHIAGADLRVRAPQTVLDVLDRMFGRVAHVWLGALTPLVVDVTFDDVWRIAGSMPATSKALAAASTLPQVAGATIATLLAELAAQRGLNLWRAAIVECDGNALALLGDDWETAITLAAHLHARGWRIVSGDYGLVDPATMTALPFRKLLHVNSSSIASFPLAYRGAVEASPWYSSAHTIAFYAIDPELVNGAAAWAERTPIRTILKIDGRVGTHPSIEAAGAGQAMLVPGPFVETADFLERWFRALPPVA